MTVKEKAQLPVDVSSRTRTLLNLKEEAAPSSAPTVSLLTMFGDVSSIVATLSGPLGQALQPERLEAPEPKKAPKP